MIDENVEQSISNIKTHVKKVLNSTDLYKYKGSVSKLLGLTVEVKLPGLKIGDLCYIETHTTDKKPAEVVAFKGDAAQLLLLYDGAGIGQGSLVQKYRSTDKNLCRRFFTRKINKPNGRTGLTVNH